MNEHIRLGVLVQTYRYTCQGERETAGVWAGTMRPSQSLPMTGGLPGVSGPAPTFPHFKHMVPVQNTPRKPFHSDTMVHTHTHTHTHTSRGCACRVALTITPSSHPPPGREGVQVRGVRPGVHPAGKHEATHADPYQRPALPVPHLLQDLRAEADPQDAHDCTLACEAIQMQGTRLSGPQGGMSPRAAQSQHDGRS